MLNAIKHAHSGLRWVVLILLLLAIVNAYNGWQKRQPYKPSDKKKHLFAMIFCHVQLLIGLVAYALNWGGKVRMGAGVMKDDIARFYTLEHAVLMILALVVITVGFSKAKRTPETPRKFRTIFIAYLTGLILILAGIPWPFRIAGAGWF